MAAPNIVNVATITGKTAVLAVTTSATAIVTNSAASGKVFKVNALYVSNVDGVNAADINVDLFRLLLLIVLFIQFRFPQMQYWMLFLNPFI